MITPLDVQKKVFNRSLRGFSERDVNHFLQEVGQSLEKHINDNAELKERMVRVMDEVGKYKAIETTLSETLIVAKKAADDLISVSKKEAEQIIASAKLQAYTIEEQTRRDIQALQTQRMMMEKDLDGFRLRMESLLRAQLDVVSHYKGDIDHQPQLQQHSPVQLHAKAPTQQQVQPPQPQLHPESHQQNQQQHQPQSQLTHSV